MGKLLYSAAMSLDGFIAGPDGDMQWVTEFFGPNPEIDRLVGDIGALLVGRRTYGGDDPYRDTEHEGKAFGGAWEGPQFVLTHRPAKPAPDVTFVDDLHRGVELAKAAAGEKYVNVLGATVARGCVEAGVLDEVLVSVLPVMLGDGVRLFERPGGNRVRLERMSATEAPQATNLWLRVVR